VGVFIKQDELNKLIDVSQMQKPKKHLTYQQLYPINSVEYSCTVSDNYNYGTGCRGLGWVSDNHKMVIYIYILPVNACIKNVAKDGRQHLFYNLGLIFFVK
jgi:hypothetical protein